jgi:hypothetical protein
MSIGVFGVSINEDCVLAEVVLSGVVSGKPTHRLGTDFSSLKNQP